MPNFGEGWDDLEDEEDEEDENTSRSVPDDCWEICKACGGSGGEYDMLNPEAWKSCGNCVGTGYVR